MTQVVLNLIITGIPSIPKRDTKRILKLWSFKPYYNWNTFNTEYIDSIHVYGNSSFKPYYNWNTFNTNIAEEKGYRW